MGFFDHIISATLPIVPKPIVRYFSQTYIAGETEAQAVEAVRALNAEQAMATVDVLGEDTLDEAQADQTVREYLSFAEAIDTHRLDCNLSVKLTAFGLLIDRDLCVKKLRAVLDAAKERGQFVRIDMEDSGVTSKTLDIYREVRRDYEHVGPVVQAYLRRTLGDIRELLAFHEELGQPLNIRLCKGIYVEPESVAFKDRDVVRQSYMNLLQILMEGGAYVGIATHDQTLLYEGARIVDRLRLAPEQYEFQMLHGVIPQIRRLLLDEGHRVRVYVPFGANWHGYSVRRLKENPAVAGYVAKNVLGGLFGRGDSSTSGSAQAGA